MKRILLLLCWFPFLLLGQAFPPGVVGIAGTGHGVSTPLTCNSASASGTAYTCTTSPTFTPAKGDMILWGPDLANTGTSATLKVNGQAGTPSVSKMTGVGITTVLSVGDIAVSPAQYIAVYDGVTWQLQTLILNSNATASIGNYPLQVAHATYSFATDGGGSPGAITLVATATLPIQAILVGATLNSTTALTSGGATNISVGTTAGSSATSILGSTAKASFSTNALLNGVVTFAAPVKMSAAGNINITTATTALGAGIMEIYVYYVVSPT